MFPLSFILAVASLRRAMQKMKQFRRLKLEEVKVLAEEGFQLNAAEYQQQVEKREAQRRQEREERLAREAMMTLKAMEQEERRAAETAAKEADVTPVQGKTMLTLSWSGFCDWGFMCGPPLFIWSRT